MLFKGKKGEFRFRWRADGSFFRVRQTAERVTFSAFLMNHRHVAFVTKGELQPFFFWPILPVNQSLILNYCELSEEWTHAMNRP
jgi:hypothetical protein